MTWLIKQIDEDLCKFYITFFLLWIWSHNVLYWSFTNIIFILFKNNLVHNINGPNIDSGDNSEAGIDLFVHNSKATIVELIWKSQLEIVLILYFCAIFIVSEFKFKEENKAEIDAASISEIHFEILKE